jgi:hypothetical protein
MYQLLRIRRADTSKINLSEHEVKEKSHIIADVHVLGTGKSIILP